MKPFIAQSIINNMPCDIVKDYTFFNGIVDNTEAFHFYYTLDNDCTIECAAIVRLGVYLNKQNYFN